MPSARWCSARLIGFAKRSGFRLASLALRLRTAVPSACRCSARLIGFAKRSGFRLASLALRWAGSLTAPLTSHRRAFGSSVFRPAYWLRQTLGLQARFARPTVGGKPDGSPYFAPPCLRRAGVPPGLLASPNTRASGSLRSPYVFAPSRLWRVGQTDSLADQSCISFIQAKSCGVMSG